MSTRGPLITLTALAAVAPALLGCAEQPAIEVRWGFVEDVEARDNGETPTLNGVFDCAGSGVAQVQMRVFTEDNTTFVASQTHDCHPPSFSDDNKLARGPVIDTPGTYRLEVVGLRGNGVPFERIVEPNLLSGDDIPAPPPLPGYDCVEVLDAKFNRIDIIFDPDEGFQEIPTEVTYDFQYCVLAAWPPLDGSVDNRFTVDADGNVDWVDFDGFAEIPLVRPVECDDGVDNDRDGVVDSGDLACQVSIDNPENADEGFTVIRVLAGFFDSRDVTCTATDATRLRVRLRDGEGEVLETLESEGCTFLDPALQIGPLGRVLAPGEYTLEAELLGKTPGTETIEVVTQQQTAGPFIVPESGGGVFTHEFDFDNTDWLVPFVGPLQAAIRLEETPQGVQRRCPHGDSDIFAIDQLSVQFDLENGETIFSQDFECGFANPLVKFAPKDAIAGAGEDEAIVSWEFSKYFITAQARAGDTVCYEQVDRALGPFLGEADPVTLRRVTKPDGSPVEGCEECFADHNCNGLPDDAEGQEPSQGGLDATCVNGYCVPPEDGS